MDGPKLSFIQRVHCNIIFLSRFEDGTLPFLDILALRHGFAALTRLGTAMDAIQKHTFGLARYIQPFFSSLGTLQAKR